MRPSSQANTDLSIAQSNLAAAEANNEKAQADLARMRPLVAKAEISQLQFDAYAAAAKVTAAQLKAAQDRVQFSRTRHRRRPAPPPMPRTPACNRCARNWRNPRPTNSRCR